MANGNGYTEMREEFEELRRGVAKDVAAQLEASAERWRQERARDLAAQKADAQAWRQEFAKDMAAQTASSAGDLRREMSDGFAAQNADAERWRQERARDLVAQKADAQVWRQEFAKDMAAQMGDLRREMSDGFAAQNADAQRWRQDLLTTVDERIAGIDQRMKIQTEELRSLVKTAAEGYGGTLDSIRRDIAELREQFGTTIGDHDRALRNHARRIAKLERR